MAEIYRSPNDPVNWLDPPGPQEGDVWLHTTTGVQQEWRTGAWVPVLLRGDVLPFTQGSPTTEASARHLAKRTVRPFEAQWVNAADGIVTEIDFASSQVWNVAHGLRSLIVDVTVLSPGKTNPSGEQKLIVPEIDFVDEQECRLTFAEAVAGTVVIRR